MNEFEKRFVRPKNGFTLVTGSKLHGPHRDYRKDFTDAIGIDIEPGPGVDMVQDLERPLSVGPFSHVVCHSVLEHVGRPWLAADNLSDAMEPGATIYITVPWVWRFHSYPDDYWRISHSGLSKLFPAVDWGHYAYEYSNGELVVDAIPKSGGGIVHDGAKHVKRAILHAFGRKKTVR